jgi:NADPH2:quinone reductase
MPEFTTRAIRIHRQGGPEVLEWESVPLAAPGPGEALLRQTAIGINFVDVYHRSGQFGAHDSPPLPLVLGVQGVGRVEAVGPEVAGLVAGDRVAYVGAIGAYAERRLMPAHRLVNLPDDVSDELAAAALLRGLTAEYLLRRLYPVRPGVTILVHAAAGGVGLVLCQWAKALGASVIGTVGSDAKAEVARAHGCDHPIVYTREDFVAAVETLTGGNGVHVVYDSVGKATFMGSLACLRTRGMAINYGTASGQVEPFPLQRLHSRSLIVTRPTLGSWIAARAELDAAVDAFFAVLRNGTVKVPITGRFALRDAAAAHRALESRATTGSLVLLP